MEGVRRDPVARTVTRSRPSYFEGTVNSLGGCQPKLADVPASEGWRAVWDEFRNWLINKVVDRDRQFRQNRRASG
jgi:hypothetical protein